MSGDLDFERILGGFWESFGRVWGGFGDGLGRVWAAFLDVFYIDFYNFGHLCGATFGNLLGLSWEALKPGSWKPGDFYLARGGPSQTQSRDPHVRPE